MINKSLLRWMKISLGLTVLIYVLYTIEWARFIERLGEVRFLPLMFLFMLGFIDRCLMGFKWNILLRCREIFISYKKAISIYFIATLLGNWTPGAIGADAIRVGFLRGFRKHGESISSAIIERTFGVLALLLFVLFAIPFSTTFLRGHDSFLFIVTFLTLLISIVLLSLSFSRFTNNFFDFFFKKFPDNIFFKKINLFLEAYQSFRHEKRALFYFFLLTLLEAALVFFHTYIAACALGLDISIVFFFAIMPILYFLLRLPLTIEGLGVQEGLFAYFTTLAGYGPADGVAISLLLRINGVVAVYLPASIMLFFEKVELSDLQQTSE